MVPYNGMGQRKTQTGASFPGGDIRVEYAGKDIRGDALPLIPHRDLYIVPFGQHCNLSFMYDDISGQDIDETAVRHRLYRIDHKVPDRLRELGGIDGHRHEIIGERISAPDIRTAQRKFRHLRDNARECRNRPDRGAPLREGEELTGDSPGPFNRLFCLIQS